MDIFAELMKLFEKAAKEITEKEKPVMVSKEVEEAYKAYGFDVKNPPSDIDLAKWTTQFIYNWYEHPSPKMNLPITGLCIAYNMTTWKKLSELDLVNLKTMVSAVYAMGYNMGKFGLRSPLDKKPQPQEVN